MSIKNKNTFFLFFLTLGLFVILNVFSVILSEAKNPFSPAPASALTISKTPVNSLQTGLIGWWTFDGKDLNATQAVDRSGSNDTGTFNGGISKVNGKIGQALKFNGSTGYIVGDKVVNTAKVTVSAWVKVAAYPNSDRLVAGFSHTGAADKELFLSSSGKIQFYLYDGSTKYTSVPSASIPLNEWVHVVGTADGSNGYAYVNGVQVGSIGVGNTFTGYSNPNIRIGYDANDAFRYFDGSIDDVRIYNRALSLSEIQQLYKLGGGVISKTDTTRPTLKTGLVGWWTMDGKDFGSATTVVDRSGSNNTGTLTGAVIKINGRIGQSLKFDGSTGYITTPSINLGTVHTISFWDKQPTANAGIEIGKDTNNFAQFTNSYQRYYANGDGANFTLVPSISNGKWHLITLSRNGGNIDYYVDGVFRESKAVSSTAQFLMTNVASVGGGYLYKGQLDDVRVYNRALSASEIAELYTQGGGKISKTDLVRAQLRDGLVGHWTFDGKDWASSVLILDKSGYNNNGTLSGGVTKINGKIGQGIKLNGTGYVDSGNNPSVKITSGTLSAWIKTSDAGTSYRAIIAKGQYYGMFLKDNVFIAYDWSGIGSTYVRSTDILLNDNKWHHVAEVFNSGVINGTKLFLDGRLVLTTSMGVTTDVVSLQIGENSNVGQKFNGLIDDARLYNRMLSNQEIYELYKMGK